MSRRYSALMVGAVAIASLWMIAIAGNTARAGIYGTCDGFSTLPPNGAQFEFCYQQYLGSQGTNATLLVRVVDSISNGTDDAWYEHVRRVTSEWTAA